MAQTIVFNGAALDISGLAKRADQAPLAPLAKRAPDPRGVILWQGPSRWDGADVVLIATFHTENEKTGAMIQTWALRTDMNPFEAIRTGADVSLCGTCPARGNKVQVKEEFRTKGRWCYVNMKHGPLSVYRSFAAGQYPAITPALARRHFRGRMVRIGAYGDPTMFPRGAWDLPLRHAIGHTGYTHHWNRADNQDYRDILMASVESAAGRDAAHKLGWRTFRIRTADMIVLPGEAICPASAEGNFSHTCEKCGACNGADRPEISAALMDGRRAKVDIVNVGHGAPSILPNMNRYIKSIA